MENDIAAGRNGGSGLTLGLEMFHYLCCVINYCTQVSQVRNAAFGARKGEGKSLPRGEGFRVRVTCVGLAVFERVIALNKFDNIQNRIK